MEDANSWANGWVNGWGGSDDDCRFADCESERKANAITKASVEAHDKIVKPSEQK